MIRRPPRSTQSRSSAASDVYKRQLYNAPQSTCSQRERGREGNGRGHRPLKCCVRRLLRGFQRQSKGAETRAKFSDQLARDFCLTENPQDPARFAKFARQLAEGDAQFAGNQIGGEMLLCAFRFDGVIERTNGDNAAASGCLLYTSPSPRDRQKSRMPSSA